MKYPPIKHITKIYTVDAVKGFAKTIFNHLTNRSELQKTRKLKDTKKGRQAFIIAGGPSVKKIRADKLKKYISNNPVDVFAMNNYLVSSLSETITPNYYLISDPDWIFNKPTNKGREFDSFIKQNNEKLKNSGITIFMPDSFINKHKFQNDVYYFCDNEVRASHYRRSLLYPRTFASLGGIKALKIADFMGYDIIYFIGIDCTHFKDFSVGIDNHVTKTHNHFYNEKKTKPHSFKKESSVGGHLFMCSLQFYQLHDLAHRSNSEIYNLDPEGYLDCFKKTQKLDIYQEQP